MKAPVAFGLRSFSGHRLKGSDLVRIVYLDEAGISNPAQEPYLVVAGILVHGDKDWPRLHKRLEWLAKRYGVRSIYDFHAKDIFHGAGKFNRDDPKWPMDRRRKLLLELASLPKKFDLPVVAGFINRKSYKIAFDKHVQETERALPGHKFNRSHNDWAHGEAFADALRSADYWLQKNSETEQALIIAENTHSMRSQLKRMQLIFRDKNLDMQVIFLKARPFKSVRIIETLHFAEKRESPLLQIADICAFTIKRRLMKKPDVDDFYRAIEPQIVRTKRTDTDAALEYLERRRAWQARQPS